MTFRPVKAGFGISTVFQSAFVEGEERLAGAFAFVGDAGALVLEIVIGDELVALGVAEQGTDDTDGARGVEDVDDRLGVMLGDLHRGVGLARGRAADEEREGKTFALHFLGDVDHFIERRRDEAAQADDLDAEFLRSGEDLFAGDHDAHVDDLVIITGEDDADDVLADVMDVALDRGEKDLALRLLVAGALLFLLHVG